MQTSRLLPEEGSANPPGGTHLLWYAGYYCRIRLGGAYFFDCFLLFYIAYKRPQAAFFAGREPPETEEKLLQRILNADIVDITTIDGGFIYAEKKMLENGSCRVSFYSYDCETSISTPITRGEYVSCKFGQNGSRIADELGQKGEFIFAQPTRFFNNCTVTLDRAGTFSLFTPEGSCVRRYEFTYQGAPVCNPVAYEKSLWCVVPERDAIINYSIDEARVLLRIGGGAQSAFSYPTSITLLGGSIFVCNRDSHKIRTVQINNSTYAINDYRTFNEPVYKYFRVGSREYALLDSGVYEI